MSKKKTVEMESTTNKPQKSFKDEMNSLLKVLTDILDEQDNIKVIRNTKDPIRSALNRYKKIFEDTNVQIHKEVFLELYNKNKEEFSSLSRMDQWLLGDVKIQLGKNDPKIKNKKITIYLSVIYTAAKRLENKAADRLKLLGDKSKEYLECRSLIFRDAIKLHLLRIFLGVCPQDEAILTPLIGNLETELGIRSENTATSVAVSAPAPVADPFVGLTSLLGPIMNMAKNPEFQSQVMSAFSAIKQALDEPQGGGESVGKCLSNVLEAASSNDGLKKVVTQLSSALGSKELTETLEKELSNPPADILNNITTGLSNLATGTSNNDGDSDEPLDASNKEQDK
jgi:hypothetical protein